MITAISSQPLGGSYKDSNFRKNVVTTDWIEEMRPSTIWWEEVFNWWDTIITENLENLLTEANDNLITEQQTNLTWSDDLTKPSTIWQDA
jgi:hypothetical protein